MRRLLVLACLAWPSAAWAQHDHAAMMAAAAPAWQWRFDAQASLDLNDQHRKFTGSTTVESQNWFMLAATRTVGTASVALDGMFSLEPLTLPKLGAAQVFQTGETYDRMPLIDYQHPHDLFMGLGATVSGAWSSAVRWSFTGALVGEPTLGPTAFMHRASSLGQPGAPLSHHTLDSTHITHGVLAGGVAVGPFTVEASTFHGREPDEQRFDIELGALDSYAARVWWRRGPWAAQVSGGHLRQPDVTETSDLDRYTASVEYRGATAAVTVAVGVNHLPQLGARSVNEGALLVDAAWRVRPHDLVFLRAELVDKDILEAGGYDPPGFVHPHPLSRVGALTLGYEHRLGAWTHYTLGLGGDVTAHRTPPNLLENYGHPVSLHVRLILKSTY